MSGILIPNDVYPVYNDIALKNKLQNIVYYKSSDLNQILLSSENWNLNVILITAPLIPNG